MIIKGSILTNQTNSIGACHLTRYSSKQPLEPKGMRGAIADFKLWPHTFDQDQMKNLTLNCITPNYLPEPILHQTSVSKISPGVVNLTIPSEICEWKDAELPMFLKENENFDIHSKWCSMFGGRMYLPNKTDDFSDLVEKLAWAQYLKHVFGNQTCDKYWIPLRKIGNDEDLKWVTDSKVQILFLPFSIGEPNGGNYQQCIATRLENKASKYFDNDCQNDFACSLCMAPPVKRFTLRGLPNGFDVDTQYTLKSEVNNPVTKEISFIGLTKSIATYNIVKGILKVKNHGKVKIELKTPQAYGILTNATLRSWPTKSKNTHGVTLKLTPVSCFDVSI